MTSMYHSTRNADACVSAKRAVLNGLACDGGLYVTDALGETKIDLERVVTNTYRENAAYILGTLLDDYSAEEIESCVEAAYKGTFETDDVAPVVKVGDAFVLELFRGPTSAFKDVALQMLPQLMSRAAQGAGEKIMILAATSGDTGKAALAGFANTHGLGITVFYPHNGTSEIQRLQMVTQAGDNVAVAAVEGNFDDTQSAVKRIFGDEALRERLAAQNTVLSSANSINIGRLVPQIVYYVYAYAKLLENEEIQAGEEINVTVPTGNFGNILAAYYAKQMGVPIAKLICASNDNKVLFDFFQTGVYDRNREFILTSSPSMDILISSNLERLIYTIAGQDAQKDAELMTQLKEKGVYEITAEMKEGLKDFVGGFATEEEVKETIHDTYQKTGYVMDTHTAVAAHVCAQYRKDTQDEKKCLVASTASPYKFVRNVMTAIDPKYDEMEDFALIDELEKVSGFPIPNAIKEIRDAEVRHTTECDADQMKETVKNILGV